MQLQLTLIGSMVYELLIMLFALLVLFLMMLESDGITFTNKSLLIFSPNFIRLSPAEIRMRDAEKGLVSLLCLHNNKETFVYLIVCRACEPHEKVQSVSGFRLQTHCFHRLLFVSISCTHSAIRSLILH